MDDMDKYQFEDRVVVANPGSVFHGYQGVVVEDPTDPTYRMVWLDGMAYGMKFRVDELEVAE